MIKIIPDRREIWVKVLSNLRRENSDYWITLLDYLFAILGMSPEAKEYFKELEKKIKKIEDEFGTDINEIIIMYYLYGYESLKVKPKTKLTKEGDIITSGKRNQIGRSVFENDLTNIKSWFFRDVLPNLNIRYTDNTMARTTL